MVTYLAPWGLLYFLSLPLALIAVLRRPRPAEKETSEASAPVAGMLLAALFLGWFFQVAFLQILHDYTLAPAALLAMMIAAGIRLEGGWRNLRFFGLGLVVALAVI